MNLDFDESEVAFRAEVREFLEKNLPVDIQQKVRSHAEIGKADTVRWQQILNQRGWGASMWPKQAGGTGWNCLAIQLRSEATASGSGYPRPAAAFLEALSGFFERTSSLPIPLRW